MVSDQDNAALQKGQEGTTGNDRGMNEKRDADMQEGDMDNGIIGADGLPSNLDERTDSSTGAGSAGATGGDVGGGAGVVQFDENEKRDS